MQNPTEWTEGRLREVVHACLRCALEPAEKLPAEEEDWIAAGRLDSLSHVEVLLCVERAVGLKDYFDRMESPPRSIRAVVSSLQEVVFRQEEAVQPKEADGKPRSAVVAAIAGWGSCVGSQIVDMAVVEQEFGLSQGMLREGAGIDSVARVSGDENELSLAKISAEAAFKEGSVAPEDINWIVASSESFVGFPSLGSLLHSALLVRDTCGVLDVGGGCLGLLNGLLVARSLLASGAASGVLVVTSDVHSRRLAPGRVPGEFAGLFGDGASAFFLRRVDRNSAPLYRLGEFQFGCAGLFATALALGLDDGGQLALKFDGKALAQAAVGRLERIIADLESRTGISRKVASGFATHQPNPRLVEMLARRAGVPAEKFPVVAKSFGNLGSSTCGVALAKILDEHGHKPENQRGPIFLAALGPGLLWGGGVLY